MNYYPDHKDVLPLADAATGLTGPAANTLDLTAGGPQETRPAPAPAISLPLKRSALRIDLKAGIVDLRSLPAIRTYSEPIGKGEYRRALDMATKGGWQFSCSAVGAVIVVTRLQMSGGAV